MNEQEPLTTSDLAGARRPPSDESGTPPHERSAVEAAAPPSPTDAASDPGHGSRGAPSAPSEAADGAGADTSAGSRTSPLFDQADRSGFQDRWNTIQTGFVDEPRKSVEQADALVAEAMSRLAETFAQERHSLETQWGEGADVSTEDLRVALQRYRSFFERLLAA